MVVQHNLTAMNSNRMLGVTTGAQAKSTEKLSSGYKINRAADDAAGLAISEKMRKQIKGLTQASANAEDGISAVQTAEGALNEVHDMLQRMNELAIKAANGTESESDRTAIQNEIDQITTEIDRVSETTKFNETYLLKGDAAQTKGYTYSYKNFNADQDATATFNTDQATSMTLAFEKGSDAVASKDTQDEVNELLKSFRDQGVSVNYISKYETSMSKQEDAYTISLTGALADKYTVSTTGAASEGKFTISDSNGKELLKLTASGASAPSMAQGDSMQTKTATITASAISATKSTASIATYYDKDGNAISGNALDKYLTMVGTDITAQADGPTVYDAVGNVTSINVDNFGSVQDKTAALDLSLHVGADATNNNQINLSIDAMSAKSLGVNFLKIDGADDSNALNAVETIKTAIQKVSDQRSKLGAVQNRLEHTIKNLDNVVENTTAAESQIRDTDMASEMVKYSNNNILSQAGQSMLAQANQSNQGVLSLLG